MSERQAPSTTTLLLDSLMDPARDAVWTEFDARYRPILTAMALRVGLDRAEAEDVAQETLAEFLRAYRQGRYDRGKGRLSSWIIAIAQNRALMRLRSRARRGGARGGSALVDIGDATGLTQIWQVEQERAILARAWNTLRSTGRTAEKTLRAFELVALRGTPAAGAAAECGMTLDEVYIAKNRVTKRLREIVAELTSAYEEDG
jgi:RNA polymerase sigma-70 factor (ECF subfamily)